MTRIEQVARLFSGGATYKQIMDQLGMPYSSVTAYVTKARQAGLLPVSKANRPKVWPDTVVVRVVLDHAEWDALDRMAADAGIAPVALARRIIVAVLDDDAAAHGAASPVSSRAGGGHRPRTNHDRTGFAVGRRGDRRRRHRRAARPIRRHGAADRRRMGKGTGGA